LFYLMAITALAGCGGSAVTFTYPPETLQFPAGGFQIPDIYLGAMQDLRPTEQRTGKGRFVSITFPSDEAWSEPVTSIYRQALTQDLTQTDLVSLVPLPAQADYTLEADILSFSCRLKRSAATYLLPIGVGMGLGLAVGEDSSDKLKTGIAASVIGLLLIPLPTRNQATVEVRLRLLDLDGQVVWEQQCRGEVDEGKALNATARDDQKLVDEFLTRAVKRCNACLLGQLRQELVTLGGV
jgi:hypothetical protein